MLTDILGSHIIIYLGRHSKASEMKNSAPCSIVLATAASKTLHVHIEITRLYFVDSRHMCFAIVNLEKLPQFL